MVFVLMEAMEERSTLLLDPTEVFLVKEEEVVAEEPFAEDLDAVLEDVAEEDLANVESDANCAETDANQKNKQNRFYNLGAPFGRANTALIKNLMSPCKSRNSTCIK